MSGPTPRYREVARLFREDADVVALPATAEELAAAEQALRCRFPDSYRWFQLEFGDVKNGPLDIYSVRTPEPSERNIVGLNFDSRQETFPRLPDHLITFSDNGGGDLICFDASALRDGECPVVWWDHELDESQRPAPAAASFADWLEAELRERAAEPKGSLLQVLPRIYLEWIRHWLRNR
jgi:SUKH superfamily protein